MNIAYDDAQRRREELLESVANDLEAAMVAQSLTAVDLAQASGIHANTIYRALQAQQVHLLTLHALAEALSLRVRVTFEPR